MRWILWILLFGLTGCQEPDKPMQSALRSRNLTGSYLAELDEKIDVNLPTFEKRERQLYPWEENSPAKCVKITKEFFRCKGSPLNPAHVEQREEGTVRFADCGGSEKHSLPLKDGKEYIYPILIDLMNHLQEKTGKQVVITSGHRCPEHNSYVDSGYFNQTSKHMIGAEASFYVRGMEDQPEKVIRLLMDYYKDESRYGEFQRWEKETDVETMPWFNQEIFIKLYKKEEGRNFDNRHPYPYVSVQVKIDRTTGDRVVYTWPLAHRNYHRK